MPNLQLFSCVERAPIHRHTVYTSFFGSFAENDCRFVFNKYEFLSIYRQTNGRYIDMTTHLDMPPLLLTKEKVRGKIACVLCNKVRVIYSDKRLWNEHQVLLEAQKDVSRNCALSLPRCQIYFRI